MKKPAIRRAGTKRSMITSRPAAARSKQSSVRSSRPSARCVPLETRLRAWWWHRQGLDGSLRGARPAEVLERAGWARSVGGAGPYLTLFARAGIGREDAEAAAAQLAIHELPAARGCTYVVPAADFALALRVGQAFAGAELRTAAKLGVSEKEIDKLCEAVLDAVAKTPLDPDAIRTHVGNRVRSLGEEGKKRGLTTTLPVALGQLQARGELRRVPIDGRLDQQRYRYVRWSPNPLARLALSATDAQRELARRFFRWVGPARQAELQWFAGLGVKASREIVAELGLVPIAPDSDLLIAPEDLDSFPALAIAARPHYALVSSLDSITATRRELASLVEPADRPKIAAGEFYDLPHHAILDRGRVIGLWEYDPEAGEIVWASFGARDKALGAAVATTEAFVRDQLGDARLYSLDSVKSRAPRLAALRELRRQG
jgi:hypothetical protein